MPRYLGSLAGCTRAYQFTAVFPTPGHTKHLDTNLTSEMALVWLMLWRVSKPWGLIGVVMNGRGCGLDVSQ
jgi:hypothetical protein